MTCASCVAMIENYVKSQEGIKSVKVSLLIEQAEVEYYEGNISPLFIYYLHKVLYIRLLASDVSLLSPEVIKSYVEDLGYSAKLIEKQDAPGQVTLCVVVSMADAIADQSAHPPA